LHKIPAIALFTRFHVDVQVGEVQRRQPNLKGNAAMFSHKFNRMVVAIVTLALVLSFCDAALAGPQGWWRRQQGWQGPL